MAGLDFTNGSMDWGSLEKNLDSSIMKEKKNYDDNRFWKLSRDENDNGGAIIRLLPDPTGKPFIQLFNHAFQSFDNVTKKKRWYINNSPETIGEKCPASSLWSALYNIGTEEGKKEARKFSRKISFYTNIKVIKDPANPQNEGKIFLWKFGTKLKDKFMASLEPSESEIAMGEEPKQLFNPLSGNSIKLKIKKVAGYLNYDDTEIMGVSSIYPDIESAKADIIENAYKLEEFLKPDAFETYEELKNKMKYVLETYHPEFVDPVQFKNIVNNIIGSSTPTTDTAGTAGTADTANTTNTANTANTPSAGETIPVDEPSPTEAIQRAQRAQRTQEARKVENSDDDLAFLDSL